jgi:hypothetical protein
MRIHYYGIKIDLPGKKKKKNVLIFLENTILKGTWNRFSTSFSSRQLMKDVSIYFYNKQAVCV